jgi:hypothetical protein
MINHGTRGGYYAHRRLGEPPCDDCRAAINEYIREYRAKNGLARNRAGERRRRRALAALRNRHREEYEELLEELEIEEE